MYAELGGIQSAPDEEQNERADDRHDEASGVKRRARRRLGE